MAIRPIKVRMRAHRGICLHTIAALLAGSIGPCVSEIKLASFTLQGSRDHSATQGTPKYSAVDAEACVN